MATKKSTAKKSSSKKSSKTTAKATVKKNNQTKNYMPTYIISSMLITLLLAVFMYIDTGNGGVINNAVKNLFSGLFGICGYFVPVVCAGVSAYLIKTKDIKRFWSKVILSFLALINVSAIVNLSSINTDISYAFSAGQQYICGGLLGACVSVFMEQMVQKVASYIILSITLIVLASFITNVSFFAEFFKWARNVMFGAKNKYSELKEEYDRRMEERMLAEEYEDEYTDDVYEDEYYEEEPSALDAANSFANDTKNNTKKAVTKTTAKKSSKPKEKPIKEEPAEEPFSNGIDEAFGKMDDIIEEPTEEVGEKKEEQPEKAKNMSESEKEGYNEEFNKAIERPIPKYVIPPLDLLSKPKATSGDKREEMRRTAEKLISVLDNFGVKAKLLQVTQGPTVTRYEIQPDTGVKLSKIVGLADDIALNLAVSTVLVAPVPGKAAVGVEIPNNKVTPVSIREMLESDAFKNAKSKLTVGLGKDIGGNVVIGDIAKMPHVLIAGQTGSGKSVCVNSIIMSILYKSSPEEVKLIMIDPKVVELGVYNGIPHLLVPVVTEPKKAAGALNWAVSEMMRRYDLFKNTGVRKLESYNKLMESTGGEKIPQLVVIIDELADLMMVAAKEVETSICRIAQKARAAGMHLVVATQRPSTDVITGLMKSNIPSRIAFAVASQVESRIILDTVGADKLIGKGDMLYSPINLNKPLRIQGCFVSTEEIEHVIQYVKKNAEAEYSQEVMDHIEKQAESESSGGYDASEDEDELLPQAITIVVESGQASVSMLQRRLKLGYARAARLVDQMEQRGIVGPFEGSKPRRVLITRDDWMQMQLRARDLP